MNTDNILLLFPLLLSRLHITCSVRTLKITEIESQMNPQNGSIKEMPKNLNKFSSSLPSFFIFIT